MLTAKGFLKLYLNISQSSIFLFHSQPRPPNRLKIKNLKSRTLRVEVKVRIEITGNIKISSISKIRKIRVSRKNCKEKLTRLLDFGENPHSNGLSFSLSSLVFIEKRLTTTPKSVIRNKLNPIKKANINIQQIECD